MVLLQKLEKRSLVWAAGKLMVELFRSWFGFRPRCKYRNDDRYHSYQQQFIRLCPSNGVILDVGGGHYPFPKATIASDRFFEITEHRTEELIIGDLPFIIFDIHNMPFRDKAIDYVYCSHILEHIDAPEQACSELVRVAKAGYIETPTLLKDCLFAWARGMHKWHVIGINRRLIFFEYNERQLEGVRSQYWTRTVLSPFQHPNQDLFYPNQDLFNTMLEWEDRFDWTVYRLNEEAR